MERASSRAGFRSDLLRPVSETATSPRARHCRSPIVAGVSTLECQTQPATARNRRDRMARVQVADDVWAGFRSLAGDRPIAAVLGELVTREVSRDRSRRLREGRLDDRELIEALDRARASRADLETIVARLERRLPLPRGATASAAGHAMLGVSDSDGVRRAETFSTNVPLPNKPDLLMAEARLMRASALLMSGFGLQLVRDLRRTERFSPHRRPRRLLDVSGGVGALRTD
jgi:hypothetical protein